MKRGLCAVLLAAVLLLTGCVLEPAENLYVIPEQPAEFYQLQVMLSALMDDGSTYSAPTAGENQQPVQMADLDGDEAEEVIVFLKSAGEQPMTLCIFDWTDAGYALIDCVTGAGSAFDQVQFVQLDGQPGNEIIVGRRLSEQVTQTLDVYALREGKLVCLLNTNYSQFLTTDLDSNGCADLITLRTDGDGNNGIVERYAWQDGALERGREADLSASASAVRRIITGQMCQGVPAVFVASEYGEGTIVTDIFGLREGIFCNLTRDDETDTEVKTLRDYYVYSCDIDEDGLIELPRLLPLGAIEGDVNSQNRSLIRWYNLLADGTEEGKLLTYHNYTGGWYLTIPELWRDDLHVTQRPVLGLTPGYCFFVGEELQFSLIAVSGEKEAQKLAENGWDVLTTKGDVIYAFSMEGTGVSKDALRQMFHFIRVDWDTGETE